MGYRKILQWNILLVCNHDMERHVFSLFILHMHSDNYLIH